MLGRSLLLVTLVACSTPSAQPPRSEAPRTSAELAPVRVETPAATPVQPAPTEEGQRAHLAAISDACAFAVSFDAPPDSQVEKCQAVEHACSEVMPELRALAEGGAVSTAIAGEALLSGATRHGEHFCGRSFRLCESMAGSFRGSTVEGESELCGALRWLHPALARAAHSDDPALRLAASEAYRRAPSGDVELALQALRALLRGARPEPPLADGSMSPSNQAASNAAATLVAFADASAQALPEIMAILKVRADFVVEEQLVVDAMIALQFMRKAATPALDLLIAALGDARPRVRSTAAMALGSLGEDGRIALGALQQRTHDASYEVREAAKQAIDSITLPDRFRDVF
jgi:hypothetical protein